MTWSTTTASGTSASTSATTRSSTRRGPVSRSPSGPSRARSPTAVPADAVGSPSWDPDQYQRFADERARPFHDLIGRVHTPGPTTVVDLGCGPGPDDGAPVRPVAGRRRARHRLVGRHDRGRRHARSWRSVAVRGGFDLGLGPAARRRHRLQRRPAVGARPPRPAARLGRRRCGRVARSRSRCRAAPACAPVTSSRRWRPARGGGRCSATAANATGPRSAGSPVRPVAEYVDVLATAGLRVDAWETTYYHLLPGPDPVLEWFAGTGLRPYLDALRSDPAAWPTSGPRWVSASARSTRRTPTARCCPSPESSWSRTAHRV